MPYTILLADDDPVVSHIVSSMLSNMGHQVTHVASGAECLGEVRAALAAKSLPDLLLLDVQLLDTTGAAVLAEVRVLTGAQRLPVIMVSANTEEETKQSFPGLDADGYLEKPFTPARILAVIEEVFGRVTDR